MSFPLNKIDKKIALIIGLSFVASIAYSFWYRIHPAVDAKAYHSIAVNIMEGNGFRESANGDILFDRSIQRAGPAYEYFLAGLYSVFGVHYEVVWIAQAILHAFSALLLYAIAKLIFSRAGEDDDRAQNIGLVAAAIFGFHPDLIEISAMLMTETLYLFLTVLTVYFFVKLYHRSPSWLWTGALAGALAAGILARPPLLLFIPIIAVWYITKKQWRQFIFFFAFTALCLTPWIGRNYGIYRQFIPTTLIGEYNLWVGNTLRADGGQLADGYNPFDEYAEKYGYISIRAAASDSFKNFIVEHPARFLELTFIRAVRYFSLIRPMGFWFYQTGLPQLIFVVFSGLGIAFLFIFGLSGLILIAKKKNELYAYLLAFTASAPILLLPTVVQSRYRFQIYPFFALAAGYALVHLFRTGSWRNRSLYLSLFFFGSITVIDVFTNADIIFNRLKFLF